MLHFFRRIRNRLLIQNQVRKYLVYAVGEVLLVVIGILLALQFNNWNQERSNLEKEEWYLINIVEDIVYQRDDLKDLKEDYEFSIETGKQVLKDYKEFGSFTKIDSLNSKLNLLMVADNFPNINNTYQELVNSGQQNLIKDKDLSIDIIDYFLFCEDNDIDFTNNYNNVFYKEIAPVFSRLHQTSLEGMEFSEEEDYLFYDDPKVNAHIKKKLADPENSMQLLNAIRTNIAIDIYHLEMVNESLEAGQELIKKIDAYLGLTEEMVNDYD